MWADKLKLWRARFAIAQPPSSGAREALQWMMMARLGMLFLLLSAVIAERVLNKQIGGEGAELALLLLTIGFGFNLVFSIVLERLPSRLWISFSHIAFDVALISVWIFVSKERESLFALLYLIDILVVSLILLQRGAWFSSILSCLAYGMVLYAIPERTPDMAMNWIFFSAIFVLVGLVGGYLSEELNRAGHSLREKQRRFDRALALQQQIISNMATGLLTVDVDMRVTFVNPTAETILGRTRDDLVGRQLLQAEPGLMPFFTQIETEEVPEQEAEESSHIEAAVSGQGTDRHRSLFVRAKAGRSNVRLQQRVEFGEGRNHRILRGDVTELEVGAGFESLLGDGSSGGRILLFQDVTKLLHLEEKLRQHEKLAAVGQLAAGIAHEIRNPLASMSGSIEMLRDSLPPHMSQGENKKLMDIAVREIERLNRLITEFLDYVKPEKFTVEKVGLAELLQDITDAVQRTKEYVGTVKIKLSFEDGIAAQGSTSKLKQVVWNLVINAVQAMKSGGEVEVGCKALSQQQVVFWVSDKGQGMTDLVLQHLYEPFFTTKERGTGLGLAAAYKIVEAHHGEIRVESKPGVGTRFEVILPRAT